MNKLSGAINEIIRLKSKKKKLRRTELKKALKLTINGFDEILTDPDLLREAKRIKKIGGAINKKDLVTDIRKFREEFLLIENCALKQIKIKQDGRKTIIKKLRLLRKDIDSLESGSSNKSFRAMLIESRNITKNLLDLLDDNDPDFTKKQNVENKLRKVLLLASGAALVGVNATFAANPVSSYISVAFGGGLIGKHL